jgi:hypothetical protein
MPSKTTYYVAAFIGSIIGGYIPTLFGASWLSFSSVFWSGIGGIVAMAIVWKIFN